MTPEEEQALQRRLTGPETSVPGPQPPYQSLEGFGGSLSLSPYSPGPTLAQPPPGCRWQLRCDGAGACAQVPVCPPGYEGTRPAAQGVAGSPQAPGTSVTPDATPGPGGTVPPGASRCREVRRQDAMGVWRTETVCF
jgi:hypothetical protein